ncbi:MAG: SDR family oxidoreductase, partial [Fimbriimonas sp.]
LEINVVAPYMCMQHAIRLMVQGGRPGKILNIGSVRSHWAWAGESGVYPASKFGLRGMTEAVAREMHWRKLPISVGLISPGETNTLMTNPEGLPAPHAMDPADVAAAIVHALSAPDGVNVYDTILFPLSMRPW